MSDKMRWRYGDTNPVVAAVDSATVIEIGDLLYLDTDDAKPAGDQADERTEAANQEAFAGKFLGVAMQRSKSGETAPIRVATTGVFEYVCPSSAFELGDLIGPSENAAGDALEDQQVERLGAYPQGGTAVAKLSIGRCAKREAVAVTNVLVDIKSTIMHGQPEIWGYSA